ncbi:hypothetical protein [Paractinoplanes rishiriensis]|uniref:Integral membrane protein n=1 Tax=Paractinoplanes rishiriensis TaxID=1050105 RepID=A0A919KA05_9ACTN|nr:hypothetical protein [Actinoplanes rishiriensis]GIF02198.1 hypothetical protein Ari01nite_96620 [Actinoplanes rishiriensis]
MRHRADALAAGSALGLFALAGLVGGLMWLAGRPVQASAAPLFAHWRPHLGPGTPGAVLTAVLVCRYGPQLSARLPWQRLSPVAYLSAVLWTLMLALVDGWQRGVAGRLTTRPEYLHEVPGVTDLPATVRGFTDRILDFQPDSWTTHVAGHPPGALLIFVGLDRAGLSGGGWAGLLCILAGSLVAVAVPRTVRLLGTDAAARATVPFLVLFPGAVWVGVSADGLFAGITATGIAVLASGAVRGCPVRLTAGGTLLGLGCYLSYGLVLMAPIAVVVLALARIRPVLLTWAVIGGATVVAAFTAAGFDWLTGYHLVVERYYQGIAARRPYAYWVGANIAILAVSAGPATAVILRRAARRARLLVAALRSTRRPGRPPRMPDLSGQAGWLLTVSALVAITAADLSGYSKAEVERIWLPFTVWLLAGAGLIPTEHRRIWLAVQAAVALLVNHLLLSTW